MLLEVAERDVVERCMGGNAHHHPGCHVGVHELGGEDRDLAAERVADLLVNEVASLDLTNGLDRVVLESELLGRFLRDNPRLPVHDCLHVGDVRVCPEVGDPVDGLGPEEWRTG